jgi:hypothetical protein
VRTDDRDARDKRGHDVLEFRDIVITTLRAEMHDDD